MRVPGSGPSCDGFQEMFRGPGRAFATAHAHDDAVLACLGALWDPELATFTCHCSGPVCLAPFGIIWVLGCAASHVPAVYCSSWADVLPKFFIGNSSTLLQPVIASREPAVALVDTLESLLLARACLTASGLAPLSWPELLAAPAPHRGADEKNRNSTRHVDGSVLHPRLSTSSASAPSFGSLIPRPLSLHESSRPGLLPRTVTGTFTLPSVAVVAPPAPSAAHCGILSPQTSPGRVRGSPRCMPRSGALRAGGAHLN